MAELSGTEVRNLARFHHALRRLLRLSEEGARAVGLTPHQHHLLLGVASFTATGPATVGDVAEFLQLRHHSVVGLVDRAEHMGLVRRRHNPADRRQVFVVLTAAGRAKLRALAPLHRKELSGLRRSIDLLDVERLAPDRKRATTKPSRPPSRRGRSSRAKP
jgi:DNA-binding MarR family transcriptional regulator